MNSFSNTTVGELIPKAKTSVKGANIQEGKNEPELQIFLAWLDEFLHWSSIHHDAKFSSDY